MREEWVHLLGVRSCLLSRAALYTYRLCVVGIGGICGDDDDDVDEVCVDGWLVWS